MLPSECSGLNLSSIIYQLCGLDELPPLKSEHLPQWVAGKIKWKKEKKKTREAHREQCPCVANGVSMQYMESSEYEGDV